MGGTMSAEHQAEVHWPRPPVEGYTFDDLFTLPDLPEHTELIDGSLVFLAPQANADWLLVQLIDSHLRAALPSEWRARSLMLVRLSDRTALEPDVMVVRADVAGEWSRASFEVSDVLLAVEVVSPSSVERDRDTKPHKYAGEGVPHFWRVEWMSGTPTAYTYRLGDDGRYEATGEHVGRLITDEPFPLDVDLTEIERM